MNIYGIVVSQDKEEECLVRLSSVTLSAMMEVDFYKDITSLFSRTPHSVSCRPILCMDFSYLWIIWRYVQEAFKSIQCSEIFHRAEER